MKWKHETVTISSADYASRRGIEILNQWGEKGWELVAVTALSSEIPKSRAMGKSKAALAPPVVATFKAELKEEPTT
jgi:hypothetical protein